MALAVTTTWINTGITPADIGKVFYREPCLICILAKRNRNSKLIWSLKPPAEPPPATQLTLPPVTTTLPQQTMADPSLPNVKPPPADFIPTITIDDFERVMAKR